MAQKIKATVLLSAYACCPDRGSEPRYGWNYLLQYARTFGRVILVTSSQDHLQVERRLAELDIRNVEVLAVALPHRLEKLRSMPVGGIHLHYLLWLRKAVKTIRDIPDRIDFAHHVTYGSLQFGSPLYQLSCPFIFGPVGGGQVTNPIFYPLMGTKARYTEKVRNLVSYLFYRWSPFFKGTMKNASIIYCANNETKAAALQHLPANQRQKVKMMLDTVLDDRFLAGAPVRTGRKDKLRALWVGRLIPRKGIEILLNVALLLKDEPFTLTMAGDGPLRNMVLDFISANGLEDTVHFAGQLDQGRLLDCYKESDLLLFLSYRDSTGLQIMEAFSQGVPVLSLDQFGASIFISEHTGIKIPVKGDLEQIQAEIAAAIRQLIGQPHRLTEMSRNAAAYAQEFSWERRMEIILQDIKPLIRHEDAHLRLERI